MIYVEEFTDLLCHCGGPLIESGNEYLCGECSRRYCAECGGDVIAQGGCHFCLSCAASSCAT